MAGVAGQPQRPGTRHRPDLDQGRRGGPQPDQGLRQGRRASSTSPCPGARWNTVPWMSWAPVGRPPRLLRPHREAPDAASCRTRSPARSKSASRCRRWTRPSRRTSRPTAGSWRSRRCRARCGDIYLLNLETKELQNLTNDEFADYAPTFSPDGKFLVYISRISGNDKLFRLDLDTKKRTQLTFGTHDDSAAQFLDDEHAGLLVHGHRPREADRARRRAQRQHLQHLDAEPQVGRAAPVHRHAHGQPSSAVVLSREGQRAQGGVRHLFQGRVRRAHARAEGADHHGGDGGLRRARAGDRLPGPAEPHAGPGELEEEGPLREDVPRGAAARSRSASPAAATSSAARR